ncbi:unnamed protein product [Didymodactylos carnosus]|uniref:Uncharacterized protein n=1 Tax=Didymodactylos carnosus TaxID=1234261 RepID=A0A815N9W5_9BILA|nr:unnamed protein product [Didymodactylos carnosus]CAF4313774.1 unnamed protein product [Didymodactylos carnosus]
MTDCWLCVIMPFVLWFFYVHVLPMGTSVFFVIWSNQGLGLVEVGDCVCLTDRRAVYWAPIPVASLVPEQPLGGLQHPLPWRETHRRRTRWSEALKIVVLALLFPPLAVYMAGGSGAEVALCAALSMAFWMPGMLYAMVFLVRKP